MSKKATTSKISYVVTVILILLVVFAVVGFFARFTNNFEDDFITYYVEYDGKVLSGENNGYAFDKGEEYKFKVGNSLNVLNKDELSYSVSIVPNITDKTDFVFENDTERYKFSQIKDVTAQFNIDTHDDYFVLKAEKLLGEVIGDVYNSDFEGVPVVDGKYDYFKMIISIDGGNDIYITFNVLVPAEGMIISGGAIIAG
ncbi:MAG: hypothetical protein ACI4MS_06420 [Candidatus Coproplasma sp.]